MRFIVNSVFYFFIIAHSLVKYEEAILTAIFNAVLTKFAESTIPSFIILTFFLVKTLMPEFCSSPGKVLIPAFFSKVIVGFFKELINTSSPLASSPSLFILSLS